MGGVRGVQRRVGQGQRGPGESGEETPGPDQAHDEQVSGVGMDYNNDDHNDDDDEQDQFREAKGQF